MSALQPNVIEPATACLAAPFCSWDAASLLRYFQQRDSVKYFPVLDASQVTPEKLQGVLENRFDFNGEIYDLGPAADWKHNPSSDIEWLILLHKFYYAPGLGQRYAETGDERYARKWAELTASWIDRVPVDFLSSDVTGRRVQNWIFAHYYFVSTGRPSSVSAEFYLRFLQSIHAQVSYLWHNLTPARNHRTLELYAIYLAAVVFPELLDAGAWREFAIEELRKNILSDVLDDGVHCELSTDYHHIVLRNYLGIKRLARINQIALPAELDQRILRALEFSLYVHRPDGCIPAISDGDSSNFLDLLRQGYELYGREDLLYVATQGQAGSRPAARCKEFATSGYYVLRSGWGEGAETFADARYLFFDCAGLGAGNHGHLDLLNIEVAAYGRPLLVDPGRYTYDESGPVNWRVLFRGTSYHNTVQVDGRNQTRYEFFRKKFKIRGPEPDRKLCAFVSGDHFDYLHGRAESHEYPVVHERKILFVQRRYWIIVDLLYSKDGLAHDYRLFYHLAPGAAGKLTITEQSDMSLVCVPNLLMAAPLADNSQLEVTEGYVSTEYGSKQPAPVLCYSQRGIAALFHTVLYPCKTLPERLQVQCLPVSFADRDVDSQHASALRIQVDAEDGAAADVCFFRHRGATGTYRFGEFASNAEVFHAQR